MFADEIFNILFKTFEVEILISKVEKWILQTLIRLKASPLNVVRD